MKNYPALQMCLGTRSLEAGFGSVAGQMLEEAEELIDFVPCPYRGFGARRRSLGIDGYAFDEADGSCESG